MADGGATRLLGTQSVWKQTCMLVGVGVAAGLGVGLLLRRAEQERKFITHFNGCRRGDVTGKPVLVVIDVQVKFINDGDQVTNEPKVQPIVEMCRLWMASGNPIVFARFAYKEGQTTEKEFDCHNVQLPGDEKTVALDHALLRAIYDSPYPERIFRVDKNRASTVTAEFEEWARLYRWTTFGICGFTSNVCIAGTAEDISKKGLGSCIVLEDLCAEHKHERIVRGDHDKGMEKVRALEHGSVMTSRQFKFLTSLSSK